MLGCVGYQIDQSRSPIELGQESGSVRLRLWAPYPLETGPENAGFAAALSEDSAAIAAQPHDYKR